MHNDTCSSCGVQYEFTPETARINLFIEDPLCNHVSANCPACKANWVIYCTPDTLVQIIQDCHLQLGIASRAVDELKARAAIVWGEASESKEEVPTFMLTPRLEGTVANFGSVMDAIPLDLMWDSLNDAGSHELPETWT